MRPFSETYAARNVAPRSTSNASAHSIAKSSFPGADHNRTSSALGAASVNQQQLGRIKWRCYRIEGFIINVMVGIMAFHSAPYARLTANRGHNLYSAPTTTEILWILLLIINPVAFMVEIGIEKPKHRRFNDDIEDFLVALKFLWTEYQEWDF